VGGVTKPKWIKVSKLEAANRQVRQAIELWFADGDAVSIHTLLYAAVDILHGLCRRAGKKRLFFGNEAMLAADPAVAKAVRDWPNFFKHGRRDDELDKVLNFNVHANLVLFSACIGGLNQLGQTEDDLVMAFCLYCLIHHPDFFAEEVRKTSRPRGRDLAVMRRISKKRFLNEILRNARTSRVAKG
jgi:hypothetical protein